jgi:3-oxoacyl-[acyl-carrier-protein] synthase-1
MTALVRRALGAARREVGWVMSDVNGEQHRVGEWSKVEVRCELTPERVRHDRLPDEAGDVGAASGALMLAIACTSWEVGCAPAGAALFALCSEGPARGAFVAEAPASVAPGSAAREGSS